MNKPAVFLTVIALTAAGLLSILTMWPAMLQIDDGVPFERVGLAHRIAWQPTDFRALSAMTEQSLDWPVNARVPLWRASHQMGRRYAPYRENGDIAFIKSGLFHWGELAPADQHEIVEASVRLLRDPRYFYRLAKPLFEITRSVAVLRRGNPGTIGALQYIATIAVTNGDFDAYRSLRNEIFNARLAALKIAAHHADVFEALASSDLLGPDVRLAETALARMNAMTPEDERANGEVIRLLADYGLRHRTRVDSLMPYAEAEGVLTSARRARIAAASGDLVLADHIRQTASRETEPQQWNVYCAELARLQSARKNHAEALAQMALALADGTENADVLAICSEVMPAEGHAETGQRCRRTLDTRFGTLAPASWKGLCGEDICTEVTAPLFAEREETVALTLAPVQSDEYPAFVQVYLDSALAMDEPLAEEARVVRIRVPPGLHEVRIRIANPRTRNGSQRRIRILRPGIEDGLRIAGNGTSTPQP